MDLISVEGLVCPKCGQNNFDKEFIEKKMYVCRTKNEQGFYCNHILAYCKTCNKIQDESEFGQHGDVWECKECGAICWPLTDKKRAEEKARNTLRKMNAELDDLIKGFPF